MRENKVNNRLFLAQRPAAEPDISIENDYPMLYVDTSNNLSPPPMVFSTMQV